MEVFLASEGERSYESSLELSWKRPGRGVSGPSVLLLTHSLETNVPPSHFFRSCMPVEEFLRDFSSFFWMLIKGYS